MASPTVENYLKAILKLMDENGRVNVSALSEALGVSKPSTSSMVKKLHEQGLVRYEKYRPLEMTEKGRKQAALIIRKHRLTERFLVEIMGFGWEEVHVIAEQIEHIKSPVFFERMDKLMDSPSFDPHGSPIPDRDGNIPNSRGRQLSNCEAGETVELLALNHDSNDFLRYLNERQLRLGSKLKIAQKEAFDGSLVVVHDGTTTTLSKTAAEKLMVTLSPPASDFATK